MIQMNKEIMNIQQWWDSFHPIDRKSICLHFDLQEYLANKDYYNLPPHIKVMLINQWISNDSIVHNTTEFQF